MKFLEIVGESYTLELFAHRGKKVLFAERLLIVFSKSCDLGTPSHIGHPGYNAAEQ